MIDIGSEQLVALNEVPRLLPVRGNGKRIHISAVYRWAQRGVRGTRLEVVRIGGTTYTSCEALQRFAEPAVTPSQTPRQTTAVRQRQIDLALKRVDDFLYSRKPHSGTQQGIAPRPVN